MTADGMNMIKILIILDDDSRISLQVAPLQISVRSKNITSHGALHFVQAGKKLDTVNDTTRLSSDTGNHINSGLPVFLLRRAPDPSQTFMN